MDKHLLVAGNGFVGKASARLFRSAGWEVTTLSRSGHGDVHADLSSVESLANAAKGIAPISHVLFCASASGGGIDAYRSVYLEGAKNLRKVFPHAQLLFTSSTSVYPQTDGSVVTEDAELEGKRETGKILIEAENVVLEGGGVVLRLAGLYGPGRSYLLRRFLAGQAEMEEEGTRVVNYTHHEDAASAALFLCSLKNDLSGEVFNVCDSSPMTQKALYTSLSEKFSIPLPPSVEKKITSKRGWSSKAVSNKKLCALGWQPSFPSFVEAAEEVAKTLKSP